MDSGRVVIDVQSSNWSLCRFGHAWKTKNQSTYYDMTCEHHGVDLGVLGQFIMNDKC